MLAFLIEQEYGAEINLQASQQSIQIDDYLEKALEHQVFRKYLTFARLQATMQARKYTEEHLEEAKKQDQNMLDYASWTKERHNEAETQVLNLKQLIDKHMLENKRMKD